MAQLSRALGTALMLGTLGLLATSATGCGFFRRLAGNDAPAPTGARVRPRGR